MAKRLDRKALKGAFARGKAKPNLDFLVPSKPEEEAAAEAPAPPTADLSTSGPQRRKRAATGRTQAKRKAGARKKTASRKAKTKAKAPAQTKAEPKPAAQPKPTARPKSAARPKPAPQPEVAVQPAVEVRPTEASVAAPDPRGVRVVHDAEAARADAQLAVSALYDGWAPSAPPAPRAGAVRRLRGRLRRACEAFLGAAVRGLLGPS